MLYLQLQRRSKTAFSDKVIRDELLNGEECTQFENQVSEFRLT